MNSSDGFDTAKTAGIPLPAKPQLYSPFDSSFHPDHTKIDRQTTEWAQRFAIGEPRMREQLANCGIGTFVAHMLPRGQYEVVQITSDYMFWIIAIDDGRMDEAKDDEGLVERLTELCCQLLCVAEHPDAPLLAGEPLAEGLRDLRRRIDGVATEGQAALWAEMLRRYLLALVWHATYRRQGTLPDLDRYTLMRVHEAGGVLFEPLLEAAYGYELNSFERNHIQVRAARECMHFVTAWGNDILSYPKERKSGGYFLNVVRVLQETRFLTEDQALLEAICQHDQVLDLFVHMRDKITEWASPQLARHLTSFADLIRACHDWESTSPRYTTAYDYAETRPSFHNIPARDATHRLDIAPISWLWEQHSNDPYRIADSHRDLGGQHG